MSELFCVIRITNMCGQGLLSYYVERSNHNQYFLFIMGYSCGHGLQIRATGDKEAEIFYYH
ncbi:hypothetical protein IWX83_003253 [Flavobacterium sp. CG_9.1]|nr:hypothetical protein [Flavobacterium sp. CG_9.1]